MTSILKKKLNKKGFTLAELLIVVAIIAVLVAVAIPTFSAQLEKSREAVDTSNLRAAESLAMADYLLNAESYTAGNEIFYAFDNTNGNIAIKDLGTTGGMLGDETWAAGSLANQAKANNGTGNVKQHIKVGITDGKITTAATWA